MAPARRPSGRTILSYGPDAEDIIADTIRLRASLKEYVVAELLKTNKTGRPLNRPLWRDFPHDSRVWNIDDEYMFGDSRWPLSWLQAQCRDKCT